MLRIAQFYSNLPHHELPFVDAYLCVPLSGKADGAYIEESTTWAGKVKTPFPIDRVDVDNRGEPYRCFAVAVSQGRLFPMSLYDAVDLIGIPVFSPELMDILLQRGYLKR